MRIPMTEFSPREIVSELDRHIVGHTEAKKAVAIALRNRWRRRRLMPEALRDEVTPKNILMIGPTGVGKTEIARRLAKLAQAPFLKVEATKFTEVGYVGRDVDQIIRDLVESAVGMVRDRRRASVRAAAEAQAEERILEALVGSAAGEATRDAFRKRLRAGELDDKEIEISLADHGPSFQGIEVPGQPGASVGMIDIGEMMSKAFGGKQKARRITVAKAWTPLIAEESDKLLDQDALTAEAVELAETAGIVFIDEIDKVASRADRAGADVSREGVQRDLLPLIEGTTVSTKYGPVKSDHVLFIASGAFHVAKPSDLLPELQGRLPIRVELKALSRDGHAPHPDRARGQPDPPAPGPDGHRGRHPELHRGRRRRPGRRGRGGQRLGREHRRPPAADRAGAGGRGHQLHGGRPLRRGGDHRRRLCPRTPGRAGPQRRPLPLHPLTPKRLEAPRRRG